MSKAAYGQGCASSTLQTQIHFACTAPAVSGSPTSKQAACAIRPHLTEIETRIFRFLQTAGSFGTTDQGIQAGVPIGGDTERLRRLALVRKGLVLDSGRRRSIVAGRLATVWVVRNVAAEGLRE